MNDDLDKFGKFVWEAAKEFDFIKIHGNESVLGNPHVGMQCAIMLKGKVFIHTELITLDAIKGMSDPIVVIKAIKEKLKQQAFHSPTTG